MAQIKPGQLESERESFVKLEGNSVIHQSLHCVSTVETTIDSSTLHIPFKGVSFLYLLLVAMFLCCWRYLKLHKTQQVGHTSNNSYLYKENPMMSLTTLWTTLKKVSTTKSVVQVGCVQNWGQKRKAVRLSMLFSQHTRSLTVKDLNANNILQRHICLV